MKRPVYRHLGHRLLSNCEEGTSEDDCWLWLRKRGGGWYGRLNLWVPGLQRHVTVQAHIALWVWLQGAPKSIDEFWLMYRTLVDSGLELDHTCVQPLCIKPDHLEAVTPKENIRRRDERRAGLR